jgi:hypothetical protein
VASYRDGFEQGEADRLAGRPANNQHNFSSPPAFGYIDGFNGQIDMFDRCEKCGDPVHQDGSGTEYELCTACYESDQIDQAERASQNRLNDEPYDSYLRRQQEEARKLK